MYYLRKAACEKIIPAIHKTDGTYIPERKYTESERAIYKHHDFSRFYRDYFPIPQNTGLHLYMVKTLKKILSLRQSTFEYCGELFDVYDESGLVLTTKGENGAEVKNEYRNKD